MAILTSTRKTTKCSSWPSTCWPWTATTCEALGDNAEDHLARLLARRTEGIFIAPFEQGEIGPDLFRRACRMSLEGLVSKHRDRAYRGGPCSHWVKVKKRDSPALKRAAEVNWSR
jgi:hypothetical protein